MGFSFASGSDSVVAMRRERAQVGSNPCTGAGLAASSSLALRNAMKAGVPAAEPAGERRSALGIEQHR